MPRVRSRSRATCWPFGRPREAANDLVRLFDHRELIVAHGNERRAKPGDVGGLAHRIREEARGEVAREAAELDLAAHGRIALEPCEGDEIQIQHGELGELGDRRLQRDRRDGRVNADGEVVKCHLEHVPPHVTRTTRVVGERLEVGDENRLLMNVLQGDAAPERTRVVAQVQRAGGAIAGEHDLPPRESTAQRELPRRRLAWLVPVCMLYRMA